MEKAKRLLREKERGGVERLVALEAHMRARAEATEGTFTVDLVAYDLPSDVLEALFDDWRAEGWTVTTYRDARGDAFLLARRA